ncbi:hypothetical protein [Halobacillus amylolyticus]|uniref:SpoVT-AbrB domain-containing protein n=1 Tax=Halobacillus amylolyticus TaxID=2932259 RepID=A0ABY4HI99_9BACI|nr:hypothetical protein [Halobacillus amylolyticus]UOR14128.1 hypothetical protein MUO15_21490 [Halobacillus amylolyticus]
MLRPIGKTFEVKPSKRFYIPRKWRDKFNWIQGHSVSLRFQESNLIVQEEVSETDMVCVIGRKGSIFIPAEAIDRLNRKEIRFLSVYVDEAKKNIVLVPKSYTSHLKN